MYRLLAKTLQPLKILCTSNNNKISTVKFSSVVNQSQSLLVHQMNNNYSRKIHIGLPLQVKAKSDESLMPMKKESKSSLFLKISGFLSNGRSAVERKYVFKNDRANKNPLGEYLSSDFFLVVQVVIVGAVCFLLAAALSSQNTEQTDYASKILKVNKEIDEEVRSAKIQFEYWTAVGDFMKDVGVVATIYKTLETDQMVQIIEKEMKSKPKEEWNPKFLQVCEKLEELEKKQPNEIEEMKNCLRTYGRFRYLTNEKKQNLTQDLYRIRPKIKSWRKNLEEIYSLIQNLNVDNNDCYKTETKRIGSS